MAAKVYDILRGSFLTSDRSVGNWRFIVYLAILALIMIASSHSLERKVHRIAELNEKEQELRSRYVELQRDLMFLQMESTVAEKVAEKGISPAANPPMKIIVSSKPADAHD